MGFGFSRFESPSGPTWNFEPLVPPEPEPEAPTEGLVMKTVDCDWMKVANTTDHHTDEYIQDNLVLRRGQTFKVKITFQRPYNSAGDKVFLEFAIGLEPQLVNDTLVKVGISEQLDPKKWSMILKSTEENSITVECSIPYNAIVGLYATHVIFESELQSGEVVKSRDKEPPVIIIFNPWCKDDAVYMESSAEREEYVLNDFGAIWRGSQTSFSPKRWNFGQFEKNILDCALVLLNNDKRTTKKSGKWLPKRRDPVWVARVLSAMVNVQDDDGVLVGNWSGEYPEGTSPTRWNGSVEIIQKFFETKKGVEFGQCWVFSGLMTTLLRTLGIPARSITNFASAHDTEGSMTIDKYFDEEGNEVDLGSDSVWNFHVWNEAWMTRPDLAPGYDGWQAVDATPQELSLNLYQTGPAPVKAVKQGDVYIGFDTGFVFAEVNSDRITWIVKENEDSYEIDRIGQRYTRSVGKFISTKAVGSFNRNDVTNDYKYEEGTAEEREAFRKAYSFGSTPAYQDNFLALKEEGDIKIRFSASPKEPLYNGDGFTINITITNSTADVKTINCTGVLHSVLNKGDIKFFIKREKYSNIEVPANGEKTLEFTAVFTDYAGKLVDDQMIRLAASVTDTGTGNIYVDEDMFLLKNKDSVKISVDGGLKVGTASKITVEFTNNLPIRVTNLSVTLEATRRVFTPITKKIHQPVMAGATIPIEFTVTPKFARTATLLVDVDSRQVEDIKGEKDVVVEE